MTHARSRNAVLFCLLLALGGAAFAQVSPDAAILQTSAATVLEKVNVNTADAETLARVLKGIGLNKAQAIVAHREAYGPFSSLDDLIQVKGIGAATVERNADRILFE